MVAAAVVGYLIGLLALRRTGIYFAMITVAIAEIFFFVEFNPLSDWTGGENGLPGVPTPQLRPRLHHAALHLRLVALSVPRVLLFRRHRDRAAHRALAGRRRAHARSARTRCAPRRSATTCRPTSSPRSSSPPPTRASPAACSACCRASCRPTPSCSTPRASSIMQTAIGGRGTLFGPLVGAARLAVPAGLPAGDAEARRGVEAGAGRRVRAAGVLPAPGHHRRHARPVSRWSTRPRPGRAPSAAGRAPTPAPTRGDAVGADAGDATHADAGFTGPDPAGDRPHQALRRRGRQRGHRLHRARAASCAASSARTARARRPSSRCSPARCRRRRARSSSRAATSPAWASPTSASSA